MNHYISNLLLQCFRAHSCLCSAEIIVNEDFLLELLKENVLFLEEFTALEALERRPTLHTYNLHRIIFLLQLLSASLNLGKFLSFLESKPKYDYLVCRIKSSIRKFEELKSFGN